MRYEQQVRRGSFAIGVLTLLVSAAVVSAAVQRMRIPSGTFNLAKAGAKIPAQCLDLERATPVVADIFATAGDAISIIRTEGAAAKTVPLQEAIDKGWVRVKGNGSYTGLTVDVLDQRPGVTFALKSDGGVIGAGKRADVAAAVDALRANKSVATATAKLDAFDAQLTSIFGENHSVVQSLREAKQRDVIWEYIGGQGDFAVKADGLIAEFKSAFEASSPAERLRTVSLLAGRKLSPAELQIGDRLFGPLARNYAPELEAALAKWQPVRAKLIASLGEDHPIVRSSSNLLVENSLFSPTLDDAVASTIKQIVPEEFAAHPLGTDLLAFTSQRRLTPAQIKDLSAIIGKELPRPTGAFDRHTLLVFDDHNRALLHSIDGQDAVDLTTSAPQQLAAKLSGRRLVMDGLDGTDAKRLSEMGIKYVHNFDFLADVSKQRPLKSRLVVVGSEDVALSEKIFGRDHGANVAALIRDWKQKTGMVSVTTKKELDAIESTLAADERIILVFHNRGNRVPFTEYADAKGMPLSDLPKNTLALTCNGYRSADLYAQTTELINVRNTFEGLADIKKLLAKTSTIDEILETWATRYTAAQTRDGQRAAAIVTAVGFVSGGTVIAGVVKAFSDGGAATQPAKELIQP